MVRVPPIRAHPPSIRRIQSANANQVALARQEATAEIKGVSEYSEATAKRAKSDLEPRDVWDRMNGPPGDIFYTGEFDDADL